MATLLTKSRYLTALNCDKRMWHEAHSPRATALPDRRALEGIRVGELARKQYPGGMLISTLDMQTAAAQTAELLTKRNHVLFEAAFVVGGAGVRVDILEPSGKNGHWNIIEVKAATSARQYLADVAIQRVVLEASGVNIDRVKLLHLNPEHRYPDVQPLLLIEDVTDLMTDELGEARALWKEKVAILNRPDPPEQQIGRQCDTTCCSYTECFKHVPLPSIFSIPRLGGKIDELIAQDVLAVSQIPVNYRLTSLQRLHANAMSSGSPYIDQTEIRKQLSVLRFPLHFFDIETFDFAIPLYKGTKPYEHIPFQFSCHILSETGELTHRSFLHLDKGDPRPGFIDALLDTIGGFGTVVAFNASYERGKLTALAAAFPGFYDTLSSIIARLWDQAVIFKDHYIHPEFGGSYSIKAVLPVLVPELSYASLEQVHNGTEAQDVWWALVHGAQSLDRELAVNGLEDYCKLDTLAMVKLHEVLMRIVRHNELQNSQRAL